MIVAQEREQEEQQQRHELHQLREVPIVTTAIALCALCLLLALLVYVRVTTLLLLTASSLRLHTKEHVEYILRIDITMTMSTCRLTAPLHLRTIRTITIVIRAIIPIAQRSVCRSYSLEGFIRSWCCVFIRVQLDSELAVCLFELRVIAVPRDAEDTVVILASGLDGTALCDLCSADSRR